MGAKVRFFKAGIKEGLPEFLFRIKDLILKDAMLLGEGRLFKVGAVTFSGSEILGVEEFKG